MNESDERDKRYERGNEEFPSRAINIFCEDYDMKLSNLFITHEVDGSMIIVPTGAADFSGMVKGNRTLAAIVGLLKEDTTREKIIDAMKERYNAPEDVIERDVDKVLAELRKIGALDE